MQNYLQLQADHLQRDLIEFNYIIIVSAGFAQMEALTPLRPPVASIPLDKQKKVLFGWRRSLCSAVAHPDHARPCPSTALIILSTLSSESSNLNEKIPNEES